MSMQINLGDHRSPIKIYKPFPAHRRPLILWARTRANEIATGMPSANAYFRRLPARRSLSDLLRDRSIWINYSDAIEDYGNQALNTTELCISHVACRWGKWTVLGTLIHELAHIAGASGRGTLAEDALLHCGLGRKREKLTGTDDPMTPYEPGIRG